MVSKFRKFYGTILKDIYCWIIAISMVSELWLGWYMVKLTYYNRWYHDALMSHKSVGMLLVMPAVVSIIGMAFNWRPGLISLLLTMKPYLYGPRHIILSLLIAVICVTGYVISTSAGAPITIFRWFDVPAIYPASEGVRDLAIEFHYYLAYGAALLIIAHAWMGLRHRLIKLRRMFDH